MPAERLSDLAEIEAAVWRELSNCVAGKSHPWRTPVLATVDEQGTEPRADARTVVLREVEPVAHQLLLYSDARAAKIRQLRSHPQATLLMWSAALGWQLRCRVRLSAEDTGLAVSSRWAKIRVSRAAQDYLSPLPPGAPLDTPTPPATRREQFAVITATVDEVDWLELHPQGHRRASFSSTGKHWLQP